MNSPAMDIVETVARAIDGVQLWWRYNDWTSDRVNGMPIEVCRYGSENEDEIIVVARFAGTEQDGKDRLSECVSAARGRAAIRATLCYYMENVSEGMVEAIHEAILAGSEGDGYGNITDFNVTEKTVSSAFSKALAELDA